jgi:NADH-quinone oxidoreductase subunit M
VSLPLSIPLWLPAAAAFLGLFLPGALSRVLTIIGSAGTFAWAIWAIADFDRGAGGKLQDLTDEVWIKQLGIHYKLGIDGLNLALIGLAAFLFLVCIVWAALREWDHAPQFFFFMGFAESAVLGALMAQDLALFVLFFDLMLLPFLFLTGIWGPEGTRVAAITKLFIYTLVGSLLMLAAAIATGVLASNQAGVDLSFAFSDLAKTVPALGKGTQEWIFLCFAAAFWVKMPAFPVHGWMPDGYRNMPLPVLAVFSAVLSKVAAYGFLRTVCPLFPDATAHFQDLMLVLALGSILYGSAMAFTTTESRLVLGYSSVAQLGFITLGVFSLTGDGANGAILQSVNHGLVVAPAFVIVALLAERAGGSEDIRDMGGIAFRAPVLATLFLIVVLANLAMPGSSNFVGEFLILLGVFQSKLVIAAIAFVGVGMAAVYSLRLFIRTMHNRVGPEVASREISFREGLVLVPLVAVILFFALYPQLALHKGEPTITRSVSAAAAATGDEALASNSANKVNP